VQLGFGNRAVAESRARQEPAQQRSVTFSDAADDPPASFGGLHMLTWALAFLAVAVIAGLFGFGLIASASAGIAQIIFFVFIALFVLSLILGFVRTPPST